MGNRMSWNNGKKAIVDALNNVANDISQITSDSDASKLQNNAKHEEYCRNQQQISISQESKKTLELNGSRKQFHRSNKSDCRGTHPISSQGREIIQACFSNHHNEIGYRIYMRVFEKRPDYQRFVFALGKEKWLSISNELRDYLDNVVSKVHDVAAIEEISRHYGERHPTETVMAWSQLTSLMFTSIRDGYYAELRSQRKMLKNCKNSEWHLTIDSINSLNESVPSIVEKSTS
ncbi:BMA-GLB-20 [Dirofilaria immitis]|nr:BMA-GLB-20 [Dirofilaria immitis]